MKRHIDEIAGKSFDIAIIGGGINGAAIAWDATLRGLKVVLFERADFGWATSSNSAKIGHCGMRYLQHADIKRLRESTRERNNLVQNAPHLVDSQPFIMPVHGHGVKGRETISVYLRMYDWLSTAKKKFADPGRRIADSGMIKPAQVRDIMPGVSEANLTGAGIWQEGQMHNTERLLLAYLRAGVEHGLMIANYADVKEIYRENAAVTGLKVQDLIEEKSIDVSCKMVINASGPWALKILLSNGLAASDYGIYASKAFSLLTRSFTSDTAFTFPIKPMYSDKKAIVDKGSSMQFAIPWRDSTMVASLHLACDVEEPESIVVTEDEISAYIGMINEGYPAANLTRDDVRNVLWGIIPAEEKGSAAPLKHFKIIDHSEKDNLGGLITVVGVKYTTSRDIAEKTVDTAVEQLAGKKMPSRSATTALWGGDIDRIDDFMADCVTKYGATLAESTVTRLARAYGTGISEIMSIVSEIPGSADYVTGTDIIQAEVLHAIRFEMACSLSDVVLRRTDLGSLDRPSRVALTETASLMGRELGWDDATRERMIGDVEEFYEERPARLGAAGI